MKKLAIDPTNGACGAVFVAAGAFFAIQSYGLELGTAVRMGPGYFPLLLALVLILFGVIIFVQATRIEGEPVGPIAWRGALFILPAPVFFGLTVRGLGFLPALFLTALIAAFASARMKPVPAILLAAGVTLFSQIVFVYGLGLPFRPFGPWLGY